jgi:hypothetical protein
LALRVIAGSSTGVAYWLPTHFGASSSSRGLFPMVSRV